MSELKVNKLTGITGTSAGAPIILSGDTATLDNVTLDNVTFGSSVAGLPTADFVHIDTQTTSSTTIIKHAMSTEYRAFRLYYENIVPVTTASELYLDFYDNELNTISGMEAADATVVSVYHETPHWHVAQGYTNEWGYKSFMDSMFGFNVGSQTVGAGEGGATGIMDIMWGQTLKRAGAAGGPYAHSVIVEGYGFAYNDSNDYRYHHTYHIFVCCADQIYGLGIFNNGGASPNFRDGARTTLYGLKPGI